jgi:hypothetical protein
MFFSGVFTSILDACFKFFICLFFCLLQLLRLDVLKVDRVLHMGCAWEAAGSTDDIRGGAGPLLVRSLASQRARRSFAPCAGSDRSLVPRSDVWALSSPYYFYPNTLVLQNSDPPKL